MTKTMHPALRCQAFYAQAYADNFDGDDALAKRCARFAVIYANVADDLSVVGMWVTVNGERWTSLAKLREWVAAEEREAAGVSERSQNGND